jgi:acyl carrier protein
MIDEAALKQVMGVVLGVPAGAIGPDASQDTLKSWDSLKHMNLVLALEQSFGVQIPDADAADITSYALIKVVLEELKAAA